MIPPRLAHFQQQHAELEKRYDEVVEKCARTMWQLRQDHGEVLRLKREKVEKDIEISKHKVKLEVQKRVKAAAKFIEELNLDDDDTSNLLETAGVKELAAMLKREETELERASSANLLEKCRDRDVPYRIRSELCGSQNNAKRVSRWKMLYADARHRTKIDLDGR
jgi:hypothetical protein